MGGLHNSNWVIFQKFRYIFRTKFEHQLFFLLSSSVQAVPPGDISEPSCRIQLILFALESLALSLSSLILWSSKYVFLGS